MALTINTNSVSLSVQGNFSRASGALGSTMERLSSGLRINSAKDDAAGMQIANRLTTQIKGMTVAARNANDGISVIQTAESALRESMNILQRMREIALQANNATNDQKDRDALDSEFQQLTDELTRKAQSTEFAGGLKLLDGSAGIVSLQVGAGTRPSDRIDVSLAGDYSAFELFRASEAKAAVAAGATSGSVATDAGESIRYAIDGTGKRILLPLTDIQQETTDVKNADEAWKSAQAALKKIDPGASAYAVANDKVTAAKAAYDTAVTAYKVVVDANAPNKALNDAARVDNLNAAVKAIDKAMESINSTIADLGAKQNRLTSAVGDLKNNILTATASRGRIQDIDYAAESAELTKNQILQQASTAILAQANQLPATILKLLQ